jgi:hypothetical protein
MIGLSYLVTLRAGLALWNSSLNPSYRQGTGLDINSSSFLAVSLIILPYIIGGIFLGVFRAARYAVPIGMITTFTERLLVFAAAAYVLRQFQGLTETGELIYVEGGPNLIGAIRSEALPYFGWSYILLGIPISILVIYFTVRGMENIRRR